jgi:hypothetical protein
MHISGWIIGIIAIIAGILILIDILPVGLVIGIFLIVWGVLEIIARR